VADQLDIGVRTVEFTARVFDKMGVRSTGCEPAAQPAIPVYYY
jgi:hypothetical protein